MIHPCKHHTKVTLAKGIPSKRKNMKNKNAWWVFDYSATSHWAVCPFFYFDRVLRTNPVCLSGLFPDLHLPTHFIAVTTSRTVSELARLTHTLSQCEPNIGTPQVTSGEGGSVTLPYCHKVNIRPCLSPLVPSRQLLQSSVGSSSLSLTHTYTISSSNVFVKFFQEYFCISLSTAASTAFQY